MTSAAAPQADGWSVWQPLPPQSAPVIATSIDHRLWQQFLDLYVVPHEDGVNRVSYSKAASGAGRELLASYIKQVQP